MKATKNYLYIILKGVLIYFLFALTLALVFSGLALSNSLGQYGKESSIIADSNKAYYYCTEHVLFFGTTFPCAREEYLKHERDGIKYEISFGFLLILSLAISPILALLSNNTIVWGLILIPVHIGIFILILKITKIKIDKTPIKKSLIEFFKKNKKTFLQRLKKIIGVYIIIMIGFFFFSFIRHKSEQNLYPTIDKVYSSYGDMEKEFSAVIEKIERESSLDGCKDLPTIGVYHGTNREISDRGKFTNVFRLREKCLSHQELQRPTSETFDCYNAVCLEIENE